MNISTNREGPIRLAFFDTKPYDRDYFDVHKNEFAVEIKYFPVKLAADTVIKDDVLARLLTFPNVLITGHQAFFTQEALTAIATTTLGNIKNYFASGDLTNEICYRCTQKTCSRKETGRCF